MYRQAAAFLIAREAEERVGWVVKDIVGGKVVGGCKVGVRCKLGSGMRAKGEEWASLEGRFFIPTAIGRLC